MMLRDYTILKTKTLHFIRSISILCILLCIIFILFPLATTANNMDSSYVISGHERVVTTYEELKDALSVNNGVTTVYLGADITMKLTGILINSNKTNVIVDGINPLDSNQTEPYTLIDYSSALYTDTIYINSSGVQSLHVRDLKITGKNYYGTFCAVDSASTANLVITYERVDYNGPQIAYHRRGMSRFIDCNVSIHGNNGGSAKQEFAEAKYLKFEGTNTIDTETSAYSVFWLPGGGTFELADNAALTITALQMGTTYGMFYAGNNAVDMTIGEQASLNVTLSGSFNRYDQAIFSSFIVKESGAFHLQTTKEAAAITLNVEGQLTINQNAVFTMNGYGGSSYTLLALRGGNITVNKDAVFQLATSRTYSTLLALYGSSFSCNDPASVLLYNTGGRVIQSVTTAGSLHIEAEQVNYWTAAGTGSFDDLPLSQWKKADGSNFIIDGTIAAGTSGNFTTLTSNYTAGDSPGTQPGSSNFSIVTARALAFGRLKLAVQVPGVASEALTGITAPGAAVRASFSQDGTSYILPDVIADTDSSFYIPSNISLIDGTVITIKSNYQFLFTQTDVTVIALGRLRFRVPEELNFFSTNLSSKEQMIHRINSNWNIAVSDSRGIGGGWGVYVRVLKPLTFLGSSKAPPGFTLPDALVFVNDTGTVTPLSTTDLFPVYQHTTASNNEVTVIQWEANRGILAKILPGTALTGNYNATLEWILTDTP